MASDEILPSESTIWLFGRVMTDIQLVKPATPPKLEWFSSQNDQLKNLMASDKTTLARIYGFTFHNEYFDICAPVIFVVRGDGDPVEKKVGRTGLAVIPGGLVTGADLRVWECAIDDISVRLDVMAGRFERILLDEELAEDGLQDFVRGGGQLGQPASLGPRRGRGGRRGRWRSDDD